MGINEIIANMSVLFGIYQFGIVGIFYGPLIIILYKCVENEILGIKAEEEMRWFFKSIPYSIIIAMKRSIINWSTWTWGWGHFWKDILLIQSTFHSPFAHYIVKWNFFLFFCLKSLCQVYSTFFLVPWCYSWK